MSSPCCLMSHVFSFHNSFAKGSFFDLRLFALLGLILHPVPLTKKNMGILGEILVKPDEIFPLLKLNMAIKKAKKQIPPEPHWAFCYSTLGKVTKSFFLLIQQLGPELRDAVRFLPHLCLSTLYLYMLVLVWVIIDSWKIKIDC